MKKDLLRHLDFIVIDILAIEYALVLTCLLHRFWFPQDTMLSWQLALLFPLIHLFQTALFDAYDGVLRRGYMKELSSILRLKFFSFATLMFLFYFLKMMPQLSQRMVAFYFVFCIPLTYCFRFLQKFYLRHRYNNMKYSRQILVAATKINAQNMIRTVTGSALRNYQFFGLAVLDQSMIGATIGGVTVAADRETLISYIKEHVIDEVLLDIPGPAEETLCLARQLLEMGVTVHISLEDICRSLPNRSIGEVFGCNVMTASISPLSFRQTLAKRLIDIAGALVGCLLTLVIAVFIAPFLWLRSPGPLFFCQTRVGKSGRRFRLYKFRSMYMDAEARKHELMEKNRIKDGLMFKLEDDPRVIKGIGSFIRKTSLDEFPQFFNVLKGDMSIVGTRPPTVEEYERYSPHHKRRLTMLPGITGLWQISGRSKITDFEEVVRLDTEYIENWSLSRDIKIILKTIAKLPHSGDAF